MNFRNTLIVSSLLAGVALVGVPTTHAELVFSESFDNQPDWDSGLPENIQGLPMSPSDRGGWPVAIAQFEGTHNIPVGWSMVRQTPVWAPSRGDADRHETIVISAESTAANPNRAKSGTGKSFVSWRDSSTVRFGSDGLLMKHFQEGFDQIYVEFYINFSNESVASYYDTQYGGNGTGLSKLFRIYHWDGTGDAFDYYTNNINPNMIWQFEGRSSAANGYGFRNVVNLLTRRDRGLLEDKQRYIDSGGVFREELPTSYNHESRVRYGGVAFENKRDGGFIEGGTVDLDQVFGDETKWTKVAFFVKMNSEPGAFDGTLIQWIDDRKSMEVNTIAWVAASKDMVQWTTFGIGGNDNFEKYPNELRHEEWYAIDDIKAYTQIPDYLTGDSKNVAPPSSPLNIIVK
ncbi:hypothetical protein [Marinobacter sp.]|uniref:hypothetical protein n=1 Tax=Marinobacter sp. TaxID=50741 RepID=UPI001B68D319|nr:hypothetical protein [Marinobacter sp.]MBQ0831320.1 hypothetical protein [Marinobacter sp.]